MSTLTPRNGLTKPSGSDIGFASITNANMDIIDGGISKCNFYSTSAPTASDDSTKGYSVGSLWVKSNSDVYVCVSPTAGAAVWRKIYPTDVVAHHTTHESGGSDAIKLDDLAAPDDNTDLNVSTSKHGLCPKAPNNAFQALLGNGAWGYPLPEAHHTTHESGGSDAIKLDDLAAPDDNTDLNVSTSKHGLCPKAPNNAFQALLGNGAWGYPLPDGWIPAGETWTYASADSPTFTFTISGDKTTKYYPGMRLKLTHSSTTKYFIVTKVSYSSPNTTVTIYGGTDYSLASGAITNPYYSMMKAPAGFPLSPGKWTVTVTNATQLTKSNPTAGEWYNLGVSINIPIGVWMVEYGALMQVMQATANWCNAYSTLSTTTNSVTDGTTTMKIGGKDGIANSQTVIKPNIFRSLTSKTTYYLLIMTDWLNVSEIEFRGDQQTTYIKAVCAYL